MSISKHTGIIGLTIGMILIRLTLAWLGYFPFTWDFGRDMLWVRQLTIEHKPMLVGAWGSLDGTFFGPAYFYLLAIPLWLSNGDPRSAVMMVTIALTALIPLGYWLGKRWFNSQVGWWWAILFSLMPIYTELSLYSFPQQLIPLVFMGLIAALWELWRKPRVSMWFASGLIASSIFHFEPVDTPIGYLLICIWIVVIIRKHKASLNRTAIAALLLGLSLPLLSNFIYDIRHNWGQLHALWRLVSGADTSLVGGSPLWQRIIDRPMNISIITGRSVLAINSPLVGLLLVSGIGILLVVQRKLKSSFLTLLGILSLVAMVYLTIFPRLLKDYYLHFVPIIITLTTGIVLSRIKNIKSRSIIGIIIIGLLLFGQVKAIQSVINPNAVTTYRYQQQVVSTIYKQADGNPFKVFIYTPIVYDYPYQYLFWWWGKQTYGYIPVEYAYKPDQPEYVYKKSIFDKEIPTHATVGLESVPTFLVLEPGDHLGYSRVFWRSLFPSTVLTDMKLSAGLQLIRIQ